MGKALSSDPTAPPMRGDILTGVQRRRRWSTTEKIRLVEEPAARLVRIIRCPPLRHRAKPAVLVEASHAGGRPKSRARR